MPSHEVMFLKLRPFSMVICRAAFSFINVFDNPQKTAQCRCMAEGRHRGRQNVKVDSVIEEPEPGRMNGEQATAIPCRVLKCNEDHLPHAGRVQGPPGGQSPEALWPAVGRLKARSSHQSHSLCKFAMTMGTSRQAAPQVRTDTEERRALVELGTGLGLHRGHQQITSRSHADVPSSMRACAELVPCRWPLPGVSTSPPR